MNLARTLGVRTMALSCALALGLSPLWSPSALAITRIGNAKFGSEKIGFEATLSKPFVFLRELDGDGALLVSQGDGVLRDGMTLVLRPLDATIPNIKTVNRAQFKDLFQGNPRVREIWREVGGLADDGACLEAFVGEGGDRGWGVVSWGSGKGIVFFGASAASVVASIEAMLRSVVVSQGACAWE